MGAESVILIGLAVVFGFYMAWNIGANDVANAMGTSVGSGALTLKRAVILAAIMEFAGAFLVGPHVSETVRKGIIDTSFFTQTPNGATMLALGMLASLLAAGVWLQLASYFGWPVSTTHSIVGAVVGFGAVYGGVNAVNWIGEGTFVAIITGKGGVVSIIASWIVSPLLSGAMAFAIFRLVLVGIFYKPDPVAAAKKATPYMAFAVILVMLLVTAFKGLKPFWSNYHTKPTSTDSLIEGLTGLAATMTSPLVISWTVSILTAAVSGVIAHQLVRRIQPANAVSAGEAQSLYLERALNKAIMHLRRVRNTSDQSLHDNADTLLQQTQTLRSKVQTRAKSPGANSTFRQVERIFVYLQIISAAFVAFAHGANDVANAIGPLSVAVEAVHLGVVPTKAAVPLWALGLGGVGIIIGLATWGWRVIQTIGRRITELTPSRGFCAEFAAALTILIASVYKLPVSTTHTLVGAVLGVGLARGIGALNLNTVRDIVVSWVITVPAGAFLAIVFFYTLSFFFA